MQRLTVTSILVAVALAGCESGTSEGPAPIEFTPGPAPSGENFVALYAPPLNIGPYPHDIYNPTGQQLAVPERITSPLAEALNTLDGFGTNAAISAPFNAAVDPDTLIPFDPTATPTGAETVFVLDATNGTPLAPDVDYTLRLSTAAGNEGSVVEILPLRPLAPRTRYVFIMTAGIRNAFDVAAVADTIFAAVKDAHLAELASVPGAPELDPLFPAIAPLIDAADDVFGIPGSAIVSAWSMSTQSIGEVLAVIEQTATARPATVVSAGITTAELGLGLPGIADIYVGRMQIPYFGDPANPLTSFWVTAGARPPTGNDPVAVPRVADLAIPVLATLPNDASGHDEPADGWPVVVFQHGITLDRTVMLALADAFAAAGFAVVAIDLPLHGITDASSPFYQGPGGPLGDNERHFGLDNVGATGVFVPDGEIDDGWQLLNLQNPLNARDHVRQAVADLIHLTRTLPQLDFPDGDANPDLDGDRIHFVGISLGSIISGVFLGLNDEIRTATLSSPAGPWTSILTDPEAISFGAPIRAALAAQGLPQDTVGFEDFVRDLQTIIDPVDPTNYAAAASANHPLHVLEVLGDGTVPNAPTERIAALWQLAGVSSTTAVALPATVSGIVRFDAGGHASLFDPAIDADVTAEMQHQTVTFAASDGSVIEVADTSVVQ